MNSTRCIQSFETHLYHDDIVAAKTLFEENRHIFDEVCPMWFKYLPQKWAYWLYENRYSKPSYWFVRRVYFYFSVWENIQLSNEETSEIVAKYVKLALAECTEFTQKHFDKGYVQLDRIVYHMAALLFSIDNEMEH